MEETEETKEEITERLDAEIGDCIDCDDAALMEQRNFLEVNTSCESVPCAIWEVVNATFKKACV